MKFFITLLVLLVLYSPARSTTHIVTISSFQFSPANLNVVVGDVIRWEWAGGFHSTRSVAVPPGAIGWASTVETSGFTYEYTVTVAGTYQYECAPHAGFMTGMFTATGTVPVQMSGFEVQNREKMAYLSWMTATESNSNYFAIRRSYNGQLFEEIGRVPAAQFSNEPRHYTYLDIDVNQNSRYVYYEIAITNLDGSVQLSPIKLWKQQGAGKKIISSLSPNPVLKAGHLMIVFNADENGSVQVYISDALGKHSLHTQMAATAGINHGHIHLGNLPAGHYTVQFRLHGIVETYKVVKQ